MPNQPPLTGLVVCLDDVELDELVPAVEVLVQEGFHTFSLPVHHTGGEEFAAIYAARARIGAHALRGADDVGPALASGATFALFDQPDEPGVRAAAGAGLAVYAQAMTPSEVRAVLELPATGAMFFPADIVGHIMATRLATLGLAERVVPRGGLGAFATGEWFKAGAPAVVVDSVLLSDSLAGGDLGALRDRCGSFLDVQSKHTSSA